MALLIAAPVHAAGGDAVEAPLVLLDHGVICDAAVTGEVQAPGTVEGNLNLIDQRQAIDVTTARVPAQDGISFGIRTTLRDGARLGPAEIELEHPPLGPEGVTVQRWPFFGRAGEPALNLFAFEKNYELQTGLWTFRIVAEDGVLLEKSFSVVAPHAAPDVMQACHGAFLGA